MCKYINVQYMDILFIEKLIVMATIGIYDWEKKCFQKLIFDVELSYDNRRFKNDIGVFSYLDYTQVKEKIFDIVNGRHFLLIEDVAEITASRLIQDFCVHWVRITVRKPDAISEAATVGVCIKRTK